MLIEARKLTKLFFVPGKTRRALPEATGVREASFILNHGESLGVVGPSGCGKTTLARLITGILEPQSGEIILGPLVTNPRRDIQLVPQNPLEALDPLLSISESLKEPLIVHGFKGDKEARVRETMERVRLDTAVLERRPRALSGGERQRTVIARALILAPKILVCDEPTASLDLIVQAQILRLLRDLRSREDLSLIFISHDPDIIRFISERTLTMKSGIILSNA